MYTQTVHVYMYIRDLSHLLERGGGGWAGTKGMGVIPFYAPENGGLHKILQPFLRGHVFLCNPISFLQKRYKTEVISNKSNIISHQNDCITKQHNVVYNSPLTLEKLTSFISQYYSVSLSSDSLTEGKYSLISIQA